MSEGIPETTIFYDPAIGYYGFSTRFPGYPPHHTIETFNSIQEVLAWCEAGGGLGMHSKLLSFMVGPTELESVTSCVSSRRSNQLSYEPSKKSESADPKSGVQLESKTLR